MLIMSAKPATASAASESGSDFDSPKTIIIAAEGRDDDEQRRAGAVAERAPREDDRPRASAPTAGAARSRPTPIGPTWRIDEREDRRERDRVAEQHGEEVERDRAEEHARVDDEADRRPTRFFHVSSMAGAVARTDSHAEDGDEGEHEQRPRGEVDGDRLEFEDHGADRRADDDSELVRDAAESDRSRQELGGHDLRRQRAAGRVGERRGGAGDGADGEEGPELRWRRRA